ncbi:aldehyde reductase [Microbaculum marinum]|uniref:Aldehyde reductase n=1 Tax=Microbaculum marinum TaxID=1764581 RepID=A0AAW9RDC5_9HYPH
MQHRGTVFLTGASGFIARHVALRLLEEGYRVRGSVRTLEQGSEVIAAIRPHLSDAADIDARLTFVQLDLLRDDGWDGAATGCDALIHTASPFPFRRPDHEDDVIRPAVDGTLRALQAARRAGIGRVVLTSSVAAVINTDLGPGRDAYDERDWSDPGGPRASPYVKSKTMAERAAWEFVRRDGPKIALTVINPGFVLGPPLGGRSGTSLMVIQRILRAKDPMVPRLGFALVDVRDVATMHVRALDRTETFGKRIIGAGRFFWYADMARVVKEAYPDRKIVTRTAPDALIRFLGLFDGTLRSLVPNLGRRDAISAARARQLLGIEFIDPEDSIREMAAYVLKNRLAS